VKSYRQITHTADIGVTVWGNSLKELFLHAACAMYDIVTDIGTVRHEIYLPVSIEASDKDELLRNWLSELLHYLHIKDTLFSAFEITTLNNNCIESVVSGEKIDRSRHVLKHEIKAVTFHNLHIMQTKSGFQTDIIFDT
jgi:SHS2 domain-containing protein